MSERSARSAVTSVAAWRARASESGLASPVATRPAVMAATTTPASGGAVIPDDDPLRAAVLSCRDDDPCERWRSHFLRMTRDGYDGCSDKVGRSRARAGALPRRGGRTLRAVSVGAV